MKETYFSSKNTIRYKSVSCESKGRTENIRIEKMKIIISISCIIVSLSFLSCKTEKPIRGKIDFVEYFNSIKKNKLNELFRKFELFPLRGNYLITLEDTAHIFININSDYSYEISEIKINKIEQLLRIIKQYSLLIVQSDEEENIVELSFNTDRFISNSLPHYESFKVLKSAGKHIRLGILVYYSGKDFHKSPFYRGHHPVKVDSQWYYYENNVAVESLPFF